MVDALGDAEIPDDRPLITLAIGDPTAYEGLRAPSVATEALIKAVGTGAYNGYAPSAVRPVESILARPRERHRGFAVYSLFRVTLHAV